jgi:hypothetical protein
VSRKFSLAIFHPNPKSATIVVENYEVNESDFGNGSQLNILIFHASLLTEPILRGAWWIAITPNSPVTMIDLSTNLLTTTDSANRSIAHLKMIKDHRGKYQLSQQMLDQLKIKNIPWDGYVVLDDTAVQVLVDYLGGVAVNDELLDGTRIVVELGKNADPIRTMPNTGFDIWKSICQKSLFASSPSSFELVRQGLIQHTVVSPNFPISIQDFHTLIVSSQSTTCKILEFDNTAMEKSISGTSLSEED